MEPDHDVPFAPPPPAVQSVAPGEDHVSVNDPPALTDAELVVRVAPNGAMVRTAL
jgi:hypothetical protein